MSRLQPIYDIAEICAQKGVDNAILCPGSRCAPLTLAFVRHPKIKTRTISDERSAAFIACGISLHHNTPTVLVCTSGSAAYHFAPAIVESYFQHIPLIIITADRPAEWIDQWDGQTIRQHNIYGEHVKKGYVLPQDYSHPDAVWHINRTVNEAINLASRYPKGPVHLNVPLRDPLYPDKAICFDPSIRVIEQKKTVSVLPDKSVKELQDQLERYKKILVMVGQNRPDEKLAHVLEQFGKLFHIPIAVDIASNQHSLPKRIVHADLILEKCTSAKKETLRPELLITFGKSTLSKNTKLFVREYNPAQHWHVQENTTVADPYQGLTHIIPVAPHVFLEQINSIPPKKLTEGKKSYSRLWEMEEQQAQYATRSFFEQPQDKHNEFFLVNAILKALPTTCNLHLSNSLPVRYASLIGLGKDKNNVHVFCNRGVSGIDGCTSVAVGHSLASDTPTILITGDMAFFHDRNAFWHNYPLPHLRVVVLNNHGGAIFATLEGLPQLPELTPYFITPQRLSAKKLADEFTFDYIKINTLQNIESVLSNFFSPYGKASILEIETEQNVVKETINQFKSHIKKTHET